ncbi:hypothetical protein PanWU01x14_314480 [Parasponia andersonii]|uniref:Uncharacterized protein n=1 Tax=Parasponia andersonii TaxID=3476 RepID=A0A2P5ANM0_PARAD|nr:hypothetical protein PanWU01x14_314480 [Parasponia andersonii]
MDEIHNCVIKLGENPQKRRDKVCTGYGARFGGDRPLGALKLLQRVKESTPLPIGIKLMVSSGDGYDLRSSRSSNEKSYSVEGVRF